MRGRGGKGEREGGKEGDKRENSQREGGRKSTCTH